MLDFQNFFRIFKIFDEFLVFKNFLFQFLENIRKTLKHPPMTTAIHACLLLQWIYFERWVLDCCRHLKNDVKWMFILLIFYFLLDFKQHTTTTYPNIFLRRIWITKEHYQAENLNKAFRIIVCRFSNLNIVSTEHTVRYSTGNRMIQVWQSMSLTFTRVWHSHFSKSHRAHRTTVDCLRFCLFITFQKKSTVTSVTTRELLCSVWVHLRECE